MGDHGGRRACDPVGGLDRDPSVRGLGDHRGDLRTAGRRQSAARRLLRPAVGRPARAVAGHRAGVAGGIAGAHGLPPAAVVAETAAERLPGEVGLLARGCGSAGVRVAGARQPRSGIACRREDLAAALPGRDARGHAGVRHPMECARRSVRGVRRRRLTTVPAAPKPRRAHRDRQPVRPSPHAAGASRDRGRAGRAAGIDGVRQLFGDAAVAPVRRRRLRELHAAGHRRAQLRGWSSSPRWWGRRSGWRRAPPAGSTRRGVASCRD